VFFDCQNGVVFFQTGRFILHKAGGAVLPVAPIDKELCRAMFCLLAVLIYLCTLAANMFGLTGHFTSKMAPGEVGVWLPWWCPILALPAPGSWGFFFKYHDFFIMKKCTASAEF
jgi:hypothetical protein